MASSAWCAGGFPRRRTGKCFSLSGHSGWRTGSGVGAVLVAAVFILVSPAGAEPDPGATTTTSPVAKEAKAVELAEQIEANQARLGLLAERFNAAQVALSGAEADVAVGQVAFDEAKLAEDKTKAQVASVAVARYVDQDEPSAAMMAAASGDDPSRAFAYAKTVTDRDARLLHELAAARESRSAALDNLRSARDSADKAARQAASDANLAQEAQDDLGRVLSQVTGDLARYVEAVDAAKIARNRTAAASNPLIQFTPVAPLPAPSPRARFAVQVAQTKLGKPYQWGATGPNSFDCSGLSQWAWNQVGIELPRVSRAQYQALLRVPLSELAVGDLVFFGRSPETIHHLGMYVGDGTMINAPYTGTNVRYGSIFGNDLFGFGRVYEPPR